MKWKPLMGGKSVLQFSFLLNPKLAGSLNVAEKILNHFNFFIQELEILIIHHHNLDWIYKSEVIILKMLGVVL